MFAKRMDPWGGWGSGKQLEEVGLCQWWAGLGAEGSSFLGDTVELPPQAGDFIQRCVGRGVEIHVLGAGEGVRVGVVDPAMDQFPGPEELQGLFGGACQGVGEGGLGGLYVDTGADPAGDQAGNVTCKLSGGNAAAPSRKSSVSEGAEGGGRFGAGLGAGLLVGGSIWGGTTAQSAKGLNGGSRGDAKVPEGEGRPEGPASHRQADVRGKGQAGSDEGSECGASGGVGEGEGMTPSGEITNEQMQGDAG